jgi:hypothetical protein
LTATDSDTFGEYRIYKIRAAGSRYKIIAQDVDAAWRFVEMSHPLDVTYPTRDAAQEQIELWQAAQRAAAVLFGRG